MRFIACAAAAALLSLPALANDAEQKGVTQQSKFATCAHESKGLKGDEHQKFMSDCLKGHDAEAAARKETSHRADDDTGAHQNRMRRCNDEARAKDLHGDERRAFVSTCLKG
jgi:hypothetical protein